MKKLSLSFFVLVCLLTANAQSTQTLKLKYMSMPAGCIQTATIVIESMTEDKSTGTWVIRDRSARTNSNVTTKQFNRHRVSYQWPDDRFMYTLSLKSFIQLREKGIIEFEGQLLYRASDCNRDVYEVNGKRFPVLIAESNTGRSKIYVLDNLSLPLVLKTESSAYNPDIELIDINY